MATATFMSGVQNLEPRNQGQNYLKSVSSYVLRCKFKDIHLHEPAGAIWKICELEDTTSYRDRPDDVNGWGKFYLDDIVDMQVVGVVRGICCPGDEFVLMTCDDKKLYGYDGEQLHVVASDFFQALRDEKIDYPASESYYNGEAFKNMNEADWRRVKMGTVGKRLDDDFKQMIQKNKDAFMQSLKSPAHS